MSILEIYESWKKLDQNIAAELEAIAEDPEEIKDCFCRDLPFGTGGLRGILGLGPNRINCYTVARATRGFCDYLLAAYGEEAKKRGVVVAYDNRHGSKDFAALVGNIFTLAGIRVYLFQELAPTPLLSFGVRYFQAVGGVMITASHNTKEYNGYKIYDEHGCQGVPDYIAKVLPYMEKVDIFEKLPQGGDAGLLTMVGEEVEAAHFNALKSYGILEGEKSLKIVYTPLHGTGKVPLSKAFDGWGFSKVFLVAEQAEPDGDFPTVLCPNPEEETALSKGISLGKKLGADIVFGTDPDCDRIGVAVAHHGAFSLLSGNEIGALLVDYLLTYKPRDQRISIIVKTIVTGGLGAEIAKGKGAKVIETLTGFKYIGQKITDFKKEKSHSFLLGYEESYGFLWGTHCRDKDAICAGVLIGEMAEFYKRQGLTLIDKIEELYQTYGYFVDILSSFVYPGEWGREKIREIMAIFRKKGKQAIPGVTEVLDYQKGIDNLPASDVLKFLFADGSWVAVRPSGTEPKIKIYYSIRGMDKKSGEREQKRIALAMDLYFKI